MAIREDYNRLNELTKSVDDALSNVILLTFLNNIFILTMQLFQMLRWRLRVVLNYKKLKKKHFCRPVITLPLMSKIYFSYSFTFLMARIIWMSINVAKVEIVAKEPVEILSSLPHYIYNEEVVSNLSYVLWWSVYNYTFLGRAHSLSNKIWPRIVHRQKIFQNN